MSACMLARMNGWGEAVQIDLLGPYPGLDSTSAADAPYTRQEGAFFGNLFASAPQAYFCSGIQFDGDELECNDVRGCKTMPDGTCDCGVFDESLAGSWDCHAATCQWQWLGDVNDGTGVVASHEYITDCEAGGRSWAKPITVYFAPRPVGEACRYDAQCESEICLGGTCKYELQRNGAACDSDGDCQNNACEQGLCGMPPGTACTWNSECQSNRCFKGSCR